MKYSITVYAQELRPCQTKPQYPRGRLVILANVLYNGVRSKPWYNTTKIMIMDCWYYVPLFAFNTARWQAILHNPKSNMSLTTTEIYSLPTNRGCYLCPVGVKYIFHMLICLILRSREDLKPQKWVLIQLYNSGIRRGVSGAVWTPKNSKWSGHFHS